MSNPIPPPTPPETSSGAGEQKVFTVEQLQEQLAAALRELENLRGLVNRWQMLRRGGNGH